MRTTGLPEIFVAREPRRPATEAVCLVTGTGEKLEARLLNHSTKGFCAEASAALRIGSWIIIDTPSSGAKVAQVRWALGRRFGGALQRQRTPDEFEPDDGTQVEP